MQEARHLGDEAGLVTEAGNTKDSNLQDVIFCHDAYISRPAH